MTENPKVNKLKVPTPEMNDLLVWIIRPMKELEQKFEQQIKEMRDVVKACQVDAGNVKDALGDIKAEFDKFSVIPNRQEVRISAIESRLKFYEDIEQAVKSNKHALEGLKQDFQHHAEDQDKQKEDIRECLIKISELKKLFNNVEHSVKDVNVLVENVKNKAKDDVDAVKRSVHDLSENVKDKHAEVERDKLCLDVKIEKAFDKCKNLNDHVEQYQRQLSQADKDNALSAMNALEALKKNLVEDLASRLLKIEQYVKGDEDRLAQFKYDMDLIEKRCDKMGTLLKEVKAELGV